MVEVVIRPARREDRMAVIEMTREVWGGTDYVPFVWHKWLGDGHGVVLIAEEEGHPVGLQHMYVQEDGDAWLEGIRVAPERRGRGIAERLLEAGLTWARWHGCPAARLTTSSENVASTRLAVSAGFRLIGRYEPLFAEPQNSYQRTNNSARSAHPAEFGIVRDFLQGPTENVSGFMLEGWTAERLQSHLLHRLLGSQSVLLSGNIEALMATSCRPPFDVLRVTFIRGTGQGSEVLGHAVRAAAKSGGISELRAMAPVDSPMSSGLKAAGFRALHNFQTHLHEVSLSHRSRRANLNPEGVPNRRARDECC